MKLIDLVSIEELRAVLEEERDFFDSHGDEERKSLVKFWGDEVYDQYLPLIMEHVNVASHITGMFRAFAYINQVLQRKKVQ
jgi:hypothetical protein